MRAVDLLDTPVSILEDGTVSVGEDAGASVRSGEDGVIVADLAPGVRMKVGAVKMTESSKHRGERHPEGDELVYLVSGSVGVSFEHSDVEEADVVGLRPGELVVVPRGMWHRLVVEEPSELIFMTPGRTEIRRA